MTAKNDILPISVIIPAYQAQDRIGRALRSVLAQQPAPAEILVVDDGSTDATYEQTAAFGAPVRCLRQEHAGVSVARNTAIEAARGEWIAFLDADDEWLPGKLHAQWRIVQACPHLRWVYSNYQCREGENIRPAHPVERIPELLARQPYFDDYLLMYPQGMYAHTITLLIHREVFARAGLFRPELTDGREDTDLWFRIAFLWPMVGYTPQALSVHHLTAGSITSRRRDLASYSRPVERLLDIARQYGRLDDFGPCATAMLIHDIKILLQEHRRRDARQLLDGFIDILPSRFCQEVRLRARFGEPADVLFQWYRRLFKSG